MVEAGNEFGLDLFQRIYSDETKYDNIMVSPLSVSLALAMTYNGANAETKTAMEKTLKVYEVVYPDKKIASVKPKSVTKRMKSKAFAASVNRENILECEKIGIPLTEFAELSVNAMKEISDVLGL